MSSSAVAAAANCKSSSYFVEIVQPDPASHKTRQLEWIECYVLTDVDPKSCGTLARDLNAVLPLRGGSGDEGVVAPGPDASYHHGERDRGRPPPPSRGWIT